MSGNRLVDSSGQTVLLRGTNMSGTEYACAQNWTKDPFGGQPEDDPQTFAALRAWRINAVRIPLNEDCWLGINGAEVGGSAYRDVVAGLVRDLRAASFYVIVDLHWSAPGSQPALSQNPAPDQDHSPAFWQSVAATFGGEPDVIFDLYNEPYFYWIAASGPDPWSCLMDGCTLSQYVTGGTPYTVTSNWRAVGMNQLIATVRGTSATNVIMVPGIDWANDLSGWLRHRPADRNVAVSWHSYPGQGCSAQDCWDTVVTAVAQQVPIVVGETGDSSAGPATYLPKFLPWCDRHQLGYLAWTWNAWANPNNVLVSDMRTGAPTPGEGAFFRQHLLGFS